MSSEPMVGSRGTGQDLYVDNDANQTTIHWPVYAFGVAYLIYWFFESASAKGTLTVSHNQGDAPITSLPYSYETHYYVDASISRHVITAIVNVPGGALVPSPFVTPSSRFSLSSAITYDYMKLYIAQIPYPSPESIP